MKAAHEMPFGARLLPTGGTLFRIWAPSCARVELELEATTPPTRRDMQRLEGGWHELDAPDVGAGAHYRYAIDGGAAVPDPASRFNRDDVHGPSEVVDPLAYEWGDGTWRGRPWHEAVIYEMHIGTFTAEGTFAAALPRLAGLAELGITAIELMPVADFPGARGWGYDGVLPFAPDASYGTPNDLKALVDAAHALGLMVLLDVVYNHFGPEGNYLHGYGPEFFDPARPTPWGAAINFSGAQSATVRDFYRHNALYWVEEYRFDGLRLDAVHAIHDDSARHIVCEIGQALRDGPGQARPIHVVLENERNEARLLARDAHGKPRCATAQWNDDLHHAAHVLLTGETDAYYSDYAEAPAELLARALAEGFAYQGQASAYRGGTPHGEPSAGLPATAFVSFLQNHDQIGNRAFGERLGRLSDARRLDALYACLLLAPHVPMLFCGEEFAASTPFLYFCDFGPELSAAVSAGRRAEFARFAAFRDEAARERIPDPSAASTFAASKLRWDERERSPHRERLALVRELLALRRRHLVPRLAGVVGAGLEAGLEDPTSVRGGLEGAVPGRAGIGGAGRYRCEGALIQVEWRLGDGSTWRLAANLGTTARRTPQPVGGQTIHARGVTRDGDGGHVRLEPAAVSVSLYTQLSVPALATSASIVGIDAHG